ncbi:hypothetical protein PR202_ga18869 [Eleusine coracana subsp. coracana]|uniref:Uncharacterized protein n=1 Tax=Eleusine coracana subsp. coracana TaxID=191504 RepID=A0AAV5CSZ7_ELECO|nr:hypothetical protein PR202_ga18869 [Eleusine coracana subsp. coracana]
MDTMTPAALHACGTDAAVAEKLLTAVVAEGPICHMPDFDMNKKKSDELAPTDAGDEDDGGDDGDEDGDFDVPLT